MAKIKEAEKRWSRRGKLMSNITWIRKEGVVGQKIVMGWRFEKGGHGRQY